MNVASRSALEGMALVARVATVVCGAGPSFVVITNWSLDGTGLVGLRNGSVLGPRLHR